MAYRASFVHRAASDSGNLSRTPAVVRNSDEPSVPFHSFLARSACDSATAAYSHPDVTQPAALAQVPLHGWTSRAHSLPAVASVCSLPGINPFAVQATMILTFAVTRRLCIIDSRAGSRWRNEAVNEFE